MAKKTYERKIVIDAPAKQDFFKGKGHEKTALSLATAISAFEDADRAIGLDGAWGSGKSSIVEIAANQLDKESQKGKTKFHFFTFDIWKSQGSAFRRTFLEHFISWAKTEFPRKKASLSKIEKRIKGKTRHLTTDNNPMLDWYGVGVLVILPFLPIFYFWTKEVFENAEGKEFLCSTPMLLLYSFLALTVVRASIKYFGGDKEEKNTFLGSLSRTLLITAKQYENQEITQHIREVDPNDFEFQETLAEILTAVQGKKNKTVFVLDNIDRIPSEEIDDYWSAVRSIFSRNASNEAQNPESAITAIVPYDRAHIQSPEAIDPAEDGTLLNGANTQVTLAKRELFAKTFDEILYVAPPVMSNSREFFEKKISGALPNFKDGDELFRVYLIFNSCLSSGNGHFTPRQIISFINELTGLFAMHLGQFPLTTIAVYICFRENIEHDPFILTDPKFLDEKLRKLAPDKEIEQNLAAILYNVDSEFALELLLDRRIGSASSQNNETGLVELSKSHGFDLRVDEVIQNHTQEWISSGGFGQIIQNYAALEKDYQGDASRQIFQSLSAGFDSVEEISLAKEKYRPFFGLLALCDEAERASIVAGLVSKCKACLSSIEELEYDDGDSWVGFLADLHGHLDKSTSHELINQAISKVTLPSNPDFVLGIAYNSHFHEIPLSAYGKVSFLLADDDDTTLEDFAKENHNLSFGAFAELADVNVVSSEKWVEVGNSIIENLKDVENAEPEFFSDSLQILVSIWISLPDKDRSEIVIADLLANSAFFEGMHTAFDDSGEDQGVAQAIFLARQTNLKENLAETTEHQNGTISEDARNGYDWFKRIYDGETDLTHEQLEVIAQNAMNAKKMTAWIINGRSNEIPIINSVVATAFQLKTTPFISLVTLLSSFSYLKELLGTDFETVAVKLGKRFTEKDIESIKLSQIPNGIISLTQNMREGIWPKFHEHTNILLGQIPPEEWAEHLSSASHTTDLLAEKVRASGVEIAESDFRNAFQSLFLGVLNDTYGNFENEIDFDAVFEAIPESFHGDLYRQCRENLSSVSASGLSLATTSFPNFLRSVISSGDKIMAGEKDNVTRHLLSTSLEANNKVALNGFLALGRRKVADFIRHSDDATKDLLKGSMDQFTKLSSDRSYTRQISDLVNGKRKTKSLWDIWFTPITGSSDEDDV